MEEERARLRTELEDKGRQYDDLQIEAKVKNMNEFFPTKLKDADPVSCKF